ESALRALHGDVGAVERHVDAGGDGDRLAADAGHGGSTPSPDVAEDLAADPALPRLAVGEETLVGGQDGDAHAAEHPPDAVGLAVDPQARLRHPLDTGDRPLAFGGVLHLHDELAAGVAGVALHPVAGDVTLALEDG